MVFSCQSSTQVNSGFINESLEVKVDTVSITDMNSASIPTYTGGRLGEVSVVGISNISFGEYDDPLFGNTRAVGLMRPGLFTASSIDTLNENSTVSLRFIVNSTIGDKDTPEEFELWEINRPWRGNVWRPDSSIDGSLSSLITTFSVTNNDTVEVELPDVWVDKLKTIIYSDNPDSLYQLDLFGFALIPTNTAKVVSINAAQSVLRLDHSFLPVKDSVSLKVAIMRSWAYSINETVPSPPENRLVMDNLLKNVISFDIPADPEFLGTDNTLRAELLLTEDTLSVRNNIPAGHIRPQDNQIEIFSFTENDLLFDTNVLGPTFVGTRASGSNEYRINISSILNSQLRTNPDSRRFYISYKANSNSTFGARGIDGTIYRSLLFGPNSDFAPKLIITKANPVE